MTASSGQIFLSHASEDKAFVEKVYARLDASSAFYDIQSIEPGQSTLEAMERGVRYLLLSEMLDAPLRKLVYSTHFIHFSTRFLGLTGEGADMSRRHITTLTLRRGNTLATAEGWYGVTCLVVLAVTMYVLWPIRAMIGRAAQSFSGGLLTKDDD